MDYNSDMLHDTLARQAFRRRLVAWFGRHARDLPWRLTRDPYRIWLSEVMLQQTTVAMAAPHFERFVAEFPTIEDLAAADEQQVLRLWEGLGYYRRARALHAAAQQIVAEHGGKLPRDVATLMTLPGIGRYTAGAIASFAYDVPAPIVETNTQRVLARLTGFAGIVGVGAGQKFIWSAAEALLPRQGAGRFNLALMELGALVCKPIDPPCHDCPVASFCEARRLGLQAEIPQLPPRPEPITIREAAVVVRKNGAVLVRQCGARERWPGLWDFPRFALEGDDPRAVRRELVAKVRQQTGVAIEPGGILKTIRHGVTRHRITLECYEARSAGGRLRSTAAQPVRWTPIGELGGLPLSVTARSIAHYCSQQKMRRS
jgi:A/G-specific adenine glycosylase